MKKELTLSEWIIAKTNVDSYRAGRLKGEKHPCIDQLLLNQLGGMGNLLEEARKMEKDVALSKYIRFDWRDMGKDITKIHYSIEILPLLCKKENVEEPLEKQRKYIEKMKILLQNVSEVEWLYTYYHSLLEKLEQGKVVKEMEDENLFVCLKGVADIQKPVWKRIFSANVLKNSKKFEQEYETKIVGILRNYSNLPDREELTDEEVLKSCGILSYAQVLEWKGAVVYKLDTGTIIDTSDFSYGTIINSQTLEHSKPIALPHIRKIMIIENKANYENMIYEKNTLYIYCHSFFSPKEVKYLQELEQLSDEKVEFFHWGDMDFGGIRIFLFNKENIFPKLKPYKMDKESFMEGVNRNIGICLGKEKRQKLEQMNVGELEEVKNCILEYGMEIEQESLLYGC
ncbi:Wadjet anti-phage system protein JetD domain-containing protein [Faecalimonas sp.]